jgi:hypothetical protein
MRTKIKKIHRGKATSVEAKTLATFGKSFSWLTPKVKG